MDLFRMSSSRAHNLHLFIIKNAIESSSTKSWCSSHQRYWNICFTSITHHSTRQCLNVQSLSLHPRSWVMYLHFSLVPWVYPLSAWPQFIISQHYLVDVLLLLNAPLLLSRCHKGKTITWIFEREIHPKLIISTYFFLKRLGSYHEPRVVIIWIIGGLEAPFKHLPLH